MKKFLWVLLCVCMIASVAAFTVSAVDDNTDTLELFGFSPDPSTYDTNALKPGKHVLEQGFDLYADHGGKFSKWEYSKTLFSMWGDRSFRYNVDNTENYSTTGNATFFTSVAFDPTGSKSDNYIARVSLEDGIWGGRYLLSIFDAKGNVVIDRFVTNGRITTATQIHVWDLEGLVSIDAGDFDGDGEEELAVYLPNNYSETKNGYVCAEYYVDIFKIDVENKSVTTKQYINLASLLGNEICEWEYTYKSDEKRYYCMPYVALTAADLNNDGVDDLMATLSFSTYYRGQNYKTKYTTAQLLDHNKYFTSVMEVYEGTKGADLVQTVRHKMLLTNNIGGYRYVLRNANAIVADVTADGSREIVIGGNYTRVTYKSTTSGDTVNTNRGVFIDDNDAAGNIIGFTTYENLKKYDPATSDSAYTWTVQSEGNPSLHYYEEDDGDPACEPVSLVGYKYSGFGAPDSIFLEGQIYEYYNESGKLEKRYNVGTSFSEDGCSNTWIGKAVAANVGNDMFSREVLMFPFGYKISGKDKYGYSLYSSYRTDSVINGEMYSISADTLLPTTSGKVHVSLALVDDGTKSTYIEYDEGNTDVYYSDVDILAIMQAPPLYEELDDDSYIGNSGTSFEKSSGTGTGSSLGGSLTAGVVAGFEQETSFLGLFKCAGAEYEFKITATVSYEDSTETSYDYSTGFATSGTTDAVAVFTVPYVRYNCTMYMPEYKLPTEEEYNDLCGFRDALKTNLETCKETGEEAWDGKYGQGCKYYEYVYKSRVTPDNYTSQLAVYENVVGQIDAIEKAIASFNKGGEYSWGEVVEEAVLPYHYCVPQNPMVTTLDVSTYDAIAEYTPGFEKISETVFGADYKPGDPTTYAHDESELNVSSGLLLAKTNVEGSGDGFLINNTGSSSATQQSQAISVEKSDSKTLGWGVATETTLLANVGGAVGGVTAAAEINGSFVWTTTEGNSYEGVVVNLPVGTPNNYAYGWKLAVYNTKINGTEVPVVGYLTKITKEPPASIAQNISVEDVTDHSATITWEDGNRPADYYRLLRIYVVNDVEKTAVVESKITSEDGKYSYTVNGLTSGNTSEYLLESYYTNGTASVTTGKIIITTYPENFSADIIVSGFDSDVIYRNGKPLTASAVINGNTGYDTLVQWQKNDGNGWEDIEGETSTSFDITASPVDNGTSYRCAAYIVVGKTTCVLYSEPITLNCAKTVNGYNVNWDTENNTVTITAAEDAKPANIIMKITGENSVYHILKPSSTEGTTFDMAGISENSEIKLYVLEDTLSPVTYPFVK